MTFCIHAKITHSYQEKIEFYFVLAFKKAFYFEYKQSCSMFLSYYVHSIHLTAVEYSELSIDFDSCHKHMYTTKHCL